MSEQSYAVSKQGVPLVLQVNAREKGRLRTGFAARIKLLRPIAMAVAIGFVGCSGRPANRPATYPVTGTVQFSGSSVAGATICFQSTEPQGRSASGITDLQGRYRLTTFVRGDGAPAGSYRVIVLKYAEKAAATGGQYRSPDSPEPPLKHELPSKYATATTSGLEATVGETALTFNVDLID